MKGVNIKAVAFSWLLVLSKCSVVTSQPGFISLDCGGEGEYNDENTGIHWTSDQRYIEAGEKKSISLAELEGKIERRIRQLRSFPRGKRNCYRLPVIRGRKYIIRASFLYGNYDGLQSQPQFQLLIDANPWVTVVINNTGDIISKEVIAMARSASISVCVARSTDDIPFISALELRPIKPSMYPAVTQDYSLFLLWRMDYGSLSNSPLRYPDDVFDRIWALSQKSNDLLYINTKNYIRSGPKFEIPSSVFRTALMTNGTGSRITWSWTVEKTGDYYIVICFAEIQNLSGNGVREFKVSINEKAMYTEQSLARYLDSDNYHVKYTTEAGEINFSLESTTRSTVGPVLNAGEIYQFSDLLINGTQREDAFALADIARQLNLEKEWTGDPCLPLEFSWDWVSCSQDSSPRIISVNLSGRVLNGTIPATFDNLSALAKLDLARNAFTGPIPDVLADLPRLFELDLTDNNLNGSLPIGLADKRRNGELFLRIDGNQNLCEPGSCMNTHRSRPSRILVLSLIIVGVATLVTITAVMVFLKRKSRSSISKGKPEGMCLDVVKVDGCRSFSYEEVKAMSGGFGREIGKGGYGHVFYGCLQNKEVAIKILSDISDQGITEFSAEVDALSKLHHKNLVKFFGYCTDGKNMVLIYEYMCNGDLRQRLDGQGSSHNDLDWDKRLKIALDAAQGLEYLHLGCKPGIIHRDVKSSNILLNESLDAKIADFGLSKTGPLDGATHITTLVKGTTGYLDPEYYTAHRLTEKSDVYSFGVLLMEIICGRRPVFLNSSSGENIHITNWVCSALLKGDIESIADPTLLNEYNADAMWKVADLAMLCTSPYSTKRPPMNEVVLELKEALKMKGSPIPLLHPSSILDSDISLYPAAR